MTTLYLVRHGEAAANWQSSADPGLSDKGRQQAAAVASHFADHNPMTIISSPLARTQETARPLAQHWQADIAIDARFAEIPSQGIPLKERGQWLKDLFQSRWNVQPQILQDWRRTAFEGLRDIPQDSVIFTHFVLINAVVGAVRGDETVLQFMPDNGSITRLRHVDGTLEITELGAQSNTEVVVTSLKNLEPQMPLCFKVRDKHR